MHDVVIDVFNVEFDGIDKCGKDTLVQSMFKVFPNRCAYQSRGLLSQIAYSNLYNRPWKYPPTEGYIQNNLFVYLTVDKDDWLKRLEDSNEVENNKNRSDVDFVSDYKRHRKAFDDAWTYIQELDEAQKYKDHFLCINTSELSSIDCAKIVTERLKQLNGIKD